MKRFLYVLVPLLLTALIIFSIGWYLFEYDPDFTRDILLEQARYQDQVGNHAAAVWFYDLAYLQSDKDDSVALELAEQYVSIGNYTKAEFTLSHAIADGGSIELYKALCRTYVAQNKLLDAVTMLNNIADPDIKAQVDAIRPEAPAPSHAPGNYSQYIHLSFTAANGGCYISADQTYPSIKNHAFKTPFILSAGESVFYGITLGENGLVSPLGIYSYVVGGVIEEVHFNDANLEQALREQLGFAMDRIIYSNELWELKEFEMPATVTDYADLKWLPNLEVLTIKGGNFTTLEQISQLSKLHTLTITDSVVSSQDQKIIANLPNLTNLTLRGCQLSTIANLKPATKLSYLDIGNNTIRDLTALSNMTGLTRLYLDHNAVISLQAISGLTMLDVLDVSFNSLASTSHLATLTNLTDLNISNNGLMNLDGVERLAALRRFDASHNNLISIDVLAGASNLVYLDVSYNTILNIDIVAGMIGLEELYISHNEITMLPKFSKESKLWTINAEHNKISTLDSLSKLHHLSYVYMDYNADIKSVDCLQYCHRLLVVSVFGTKVSNVQVLKDMSVQVYYDPT
jgi:Leucine-rich repeat (LRR) protein